MISKTKERKGFWTGGNDLSSEGSWEWTDGSPGIKKS